MGGARCSYQNCTQKSEKNIHMFHYPVFDKLRCHQWITNAQRFNYLNLKLSQLKNRMVCQHHFTDDCFMNIMKNKLKKNAIPTEYGPHCSKPNKEHEYAAQDNRDSELPINIDDIENEFMTKTDRQAHLSVKYADFLTNDVSDTITLTPDYKSTSIMLKDKGMIFNRFDRKMHSPNNPTSHNSNIRKITNFPRMTRADNKSADESAMFDNKLPDPKVVTIKFDELKLNTSEHNNMKPSESVSSKPQIPNSDQVTKQIPLSKKVRIISEEKHISEPLRIPPGELQPVSPSIVIKVPDKKKRSNIKIDGKEIATFYLNEMNNLQLLPTKNMQESDSFTSIYTHSPQVPVMDQMHLNSYDQPTICVDQMGLNNLAIQNPDSLGDIKRIEYLSSEANCNSQQLEQDTGLFTNMDHNTSTAPNVEFVSSSITGPSMFTLTDVPKVSTSVTNSSFVNNTFPAPENALLSMDSEMLVNQEQVSSIPTKIVTDTLEISKNMQSIVNEKPMSKSSSPNKSMTKYKMRPEKLAAIEEKRKYNMKLRDIINSCLSNMDDEPDVGKLTVAMKKELCEKKVGEHLSKDSNKPHSQDDIISYFETRLQRMEDNLLNKIEQNSLKIIDLKKTFKKQNPIKKSAFSQTYFTAEATKRSLYQEVSQYLTPDTNSLIYEELFINQRVSKTEPKRRKRTFNNDKEL